MMNYDVFRSDSGKAIPAVVFYSLGKPRVERREQQIGSFLGDQMANIRKSDDTVEPDDIPRRSAGFADDKIAQTIGRAGRERQPDDLAAPPPFERRLEHGYQVLSLLFNLDVAVP